MKLFSQKTIISILASLFTALFLFGGWFLFIRDGGSNSDNTSDNVSNDEMTTDELDSILKEEQDFVENQDLDTDIDTDELISDLPIQKNDEVPAEDTLDPHMRTAKELIKTFHINEAEEELGLADDGEEKAYYLGLVSAYKGDSESAITHLTRAKELDADRTIISLYAGSYLDIFTFYETFSDPTPEYLDTLISKNFLATGELQLGIAKLKFILSEHPDYEDAIILLGSAYMIHGNFEQAIVALTSALPTNRSEVYYWLGLAYYYNNNYKKANIAYKQAENKAYEPLYHLYEKMGNSYLAEKDYKKAATYYKKSVMQDEARYFIDLYIRPVWIYNDILHDPDNALEISERAQKYNPNSAMADNLLGWTYIAMKEYDTALEYLFDAMEKDDEIPAVYLNIGLAYKAQEEYNDAIKYFEEAIDRDDGSIAKRAKAEKIKTQALLDEE